MVGNSNQGIPEMTTEIMRLIRHGVAPLIAYAVAGGYLPESMAGDVTEFIVLGVAIIAPLVFSWLRDQSK